MIDYQKLAQAHELCDKSDGYYFSCDYSNKYGISQITLCHNEKYDKDCKDIDDLITKLRELTQPEKPKPKYKEAWYLINNQIKCTLVHNRECYQFCDESDLESLGRTMYPSRQALIDSQIEYWTNLKSEQ